MSAFSFLKKISGRFSARGMLSFWYRHYKKLFFLGFFAVLLIGGWNWYYSFYQYRLSDEEKKQYVEQYFKETAFQETEFREVTEALMERARLHEETLKPKRNIFEGTGIQEKETQ